MKIHVDHVSVHTDSLLAGKLNQVLQLLADNKEILMSNQDKIAALAAALDTATTGIRGDIAALKAANSAGETLDWSPLDARVDALNALDLENPPPTPAP